MTDATTYITSDAPARIAVDIRGTGPLVITVPGMGDLRSADAALADALAADGYRVVSMDLRGHGGSDLGFAELGDSPTASDIVVLIEQHGGPAVVIGTSMGASSAVLAAANRPDLVAGLVLLSPFVRNGGGNPALMRLLYRMLFAWPWGAAAWAKFYATKLNAGATPADHAAHVAEIRAALRRPGYLADFRRLAVVLDHQEVADRVHEVQAPAIAVIGELDPDYADPAAELAHVAAVLSAQPILVPDAAHYPHRQRPDLVLPAVRDFLALHHPATPAGVENA